MREQPAGRVAFIVGGASGIGAATVETLASHGWRVAVGDRNVDGAKRLVSRLVESGSEAMAVPVDVTDAASVDRATKGAVEEWGRLDLVVPCAGVIDPSPSEHLTDESLFRMIDIHLLGTIRCVRAAFPYLKEAPSPSIVVVSSVAAHIGVPHRLSYSAAKGGLEAIVKTLAVEWAAHNIRINAVAPGWARTPMIVRAVDEGRLDVGTLERLSPFGRMAEPFEVAEVIAFLASPGAGFISGTTVLVDGALTIKGPWPLGVEPPVALSTR